MSELAAAKEGSHKIVGVVLRSSAKTVHFIRHAEGTGHPSSRVVHDEHVARVVAL